MTREETLFRFKLIKELDAIGVKPYNKQQFSEMVECAIEALEACNETIN